MKTWSRTQRHVALSSGEAELHVATRAAQELMGFQALAPDLGIDVRVELNVDAQATAGTVSRRGLERRRHVDVQDLCLQKAVSDRRVEVKKIRRDIDVADMMTKYSTPNDTLRLLQRIGGVQD